VANLEAHVQKEDLEEIFGKDARLKSVKIDMPGVAEVVFARREDAVAAVSKFDRVLLDQRPMMLKLDENPMGNVHSKSSAARRVRASDSRGSAVKRMLKDAF